MSSIENNMNKITSEFVGDMGIKQIYIGDVLIKERKSSYLYIELETREDDK